MRFSSLDQWLAWQETLHPAAIEMTLERPRAVLERMALPPFTCPLVTVAGTNGKGSTVALLEAIYGAAGYRTGVYTSPHLIRYNERIRIGGTPVDDGTLCAAFERVDAARGETSLTYFEFGTLAAFDLFARESLDLVILEVGMGGRLDAVNLLDADVAVITPIDIDHGAWLGDTREAIALEKAGILRPARSAVCTDPTPPATLQERARQQETLLLRIGHDFGVEVADEAWSWWSRRGRRGALPWPALRGRVQLDNAAGVLMVVELLENRLPLSQQAIRDGLHRVVLAGRFQLLPGEVATILDVAHNPQATRILADNLRAAPCSGQTHGVVAMLADKDIDNALNGVRSQIDHWYPAGLSVPRGTEEATLSEALRRIGVDYPGPGFSGVAAAYRAARMTAVPGDRIVVFGSFYTVAEVLAQAV